MNFLLRISLRKLIRRPFTSSLIVLSMSMGILSSLGANQFSILLKLVRIPLGVTLLSLPPGIGISLILGREWLSNFANRIDLSPLYIFFPALLLLLVALASCFHAAWKASVLGPYEYIREEKTMVIFGRGIYCKSMAKIVAE